MLDLDYLDNTGERDGFLLPQGQVAEAVPPRVEAIVTATDAPQGQRSLVSALVDHIQSFSDMPAFEILRLANSVNGDSERRRVDYVNKSAEKDAPCIKIHALTTSDDEISPSHPETKSKPYSGRREAAGGSISKLNPTQLRTPARSSEPQSYRHVRVLPIAWNNTEDKWSPRRELENLTSVFRESFFGEVHEICGITAGPGNSAFDGVKKAIKTCMHGLGRDDLLILLYNGHASPDESKNMMLL